MSPSDNYLGQSFLDEEQLQAMMSSSERKGSSIETVREESLDYSPRSPEDKETSVDVAYEESRRSTKRKREDDPDTRGMATQVLVGRESNVSGSERLTLSGRTPAAYRLAGRLSSARYF
jgi:hypothetical protein